MTNLFFADLVRETSVGTGAGALVLAGALPGHRRFADTVPAGAEFPYAIAGVTHPMQYETGIGRLDEAGRLVRAPVTSSAGEAAADLLPGLKTIALAPGADWFAGQQAAVRDHGHDIDDIDRLEARLGQKQDAGDYAAASHGHPYLPLAGGTVAGTLRVRGPACFGPGEATDRLEVHGVHGDTRARLMSDSAGVVATLDLYASQPGVEFGGSGIGSNIAAYPFFGARDAAQGSAAIQFREDGTIRIQSGAPGGALSDRLVIRPGETRPGADGTFALGSAAVRWGVIYAASGTISTSDAAVKQDVTAIPDDWLDAWDRVEWRCFRFREAVAAKGDAARLHVGLIAQGIAAAFAARGIDARAIGLLCVDGEGDAARWGLRYAECFGLEAASLRRRIGRIEAAMTGAAP